VVCCLEILPGKQKYKGGEGKGADFTNTWEKGPVKAHRFAERGGLKLRESSSSGQGGVGITEMVLSEEGGMRKATVIFVKKWRKMGSGRRAGGKKGHWAKM